MKLYGIQCRLCGSVIFSRSLEDRRHCKCKAIYISAGPHLVNYAINKLKDCPSCMKLSMDTENIVFVVIDVDLTTENLSKDFDSASLHDKGQYGLLVFKKGSWPAYVISVEYVDPKEVNRIYEQNYEF